MISHLVRASVAIVLLATSAGAEEVPNEARSEIEKMFQGLQSGAEATSGDLPDLYSSILTRGQQPVADSDVENILTPERSAQEADTGSEVSEEDVANVYLSDESYEEASSLSSDLGNWELKRLRDGTPVVMATHDQTSAVEIVEGMVLGHLGKIRSITEIDGSLEVIFTDGTILEEVH